MKHTDHPNWKNLSNAEKNNVRRENYKKRDLKKTISKLEGWIKDKKCLGEPTFRLEGLLKRKKKSLEGNPFYSGNIDDNFIEDMRNIFLDYENSSVKS